MPDPAPWSRGCLHVYTGDGKGKTTAALGLALRAAGHGLRVYVGQFMKRHPYGELAALERLGGAVVVEQLGSPACLPWSPRPDPAEVRLATDGLARVRERLTSGAFQVVVADELNVAVHWGLVPIAGVLELAASRPPQVELVITGRYARPELLAVADLVTEMQNVKHPFARGLEARDGIER